MRFYWLFFVSAFAQVSIQACAYRVTCYYNAVAYYRRPPMHFWVDDIPGDLCDTTIYAFVGLNQTSYEVMILEPYVDVELEGLNKAVALKKKFPYLKVLLGVGGWGEKIKKYSDMVTDPDKRDTFVESIVDFISKYGFDGLHIDWEYPGDIANGGRLSDKRNFVLLLKELKEEFKSRGWQLTAVVPASHQMVLRGYDVAEISRLLDDIYVLSYGMRDVSSGKADVHSPLYSRKSDPVNVTKLNVNDAISMWLGFGAPKTKIHLGISFLGRSYTLKDPRDNLPQAPIVGFGKKTKYTRKEGLMSYYEICSRLQSEEWDRGFDDVAKVPFMCKGDQWVSYEDSQSLAYKVNYVKKQGLAGMVTWAVDLDDFRGVCGMKFPLLRTLQLRLDNFAITR